MSSSIIVNLLKRLESNPYKRSIIFSEGVNPIIQSVAHRLVNENICNVALVFVNQKSVPKDLNTKIQIYVLSDIDLHFYAHQLFLIRKGKVTEQQAQELVLLPHYFAMLLVANGTIDCYLGGIATATSQVLRAAFQVLGLKDKQHPATSAFLLAKKNDPEQRPLLFADCALTVEPTSNDLVNITDHTIALAKLLGFQQQNVALLAYSTLGSGSGSNIDEIVSATKTLQQKQYDQTTTIIGEIQFDAAYSALTRQKKIPEHSLCDQEANIFIFPSLHAGNIGYKIAQYLGNYLAMGPIISGLKAPANDLSRGASEDDVYATAIITLNQITRSGNNH